MLPASAPPPDDRASQPADPDPYAEPDLDEVEGLLAAVLAEPEERRSEAFERAVHSRPESASALRERLAVLRRLGVDLGPALGEIAELPEVLGDFRLLRRLGGGGMGVVFLAHQASLGREVALKVVRPDQAYFPRARERFRREVEALARLQHASIVSIHAGGEENGVPYLAMERFRGCTLAEALHALRDRAPDSLRASDLWSCAARAAGLDAAPASEEASWPDACARVARQIAQALEHAHSLGIVHRDVKPSNVALLPDGRALLFDFGLTSLQQEQSMTGTGAMLGTLAYMAPEQIRGARAADARCDVYSLGVTLYEMLALSPPFLADDSLELQRLILAGDPPPIRPRNRRVPEDLETVARVAMDPDPWRRYPSAEAFALDLGRVLERRPIEARPPSSYVRLARWTQRRPALATGLALGALLLFGVPSALYVQSELHGRKLQSALDGERLAKEQASKSALASERSLDLVLDLFSGAAPRIARRGNVTALDLLELGAQRASTRLADQPLHRGRIELVLGRVYADLGRHDEAARTLERAVETLRSPAANDPPGRASQWLAGALFSQGEALTKLGELERAREVLDQALSTAGALGREGEYIALNALSALGDRALAAGDLDEAERRFREVLSREESQPETRVASLAITRLNLGTALSEQGRTAEAEPLLASALEDLADLHEEPHPDLAHALIMAGLAAKRAGRLDQAEALDRQGLELARTLWGDECETVATALVNLSGVLEARGDLAGAEAELRRAVPILEQVFGRESYGAAVARGNLAGVLTRKGDCAGAEELYLEVLPLQALVFGESSPLIGFSHHNLARCAERRGDLRAAREHWLAAAEIMERCPGQEAKAAECRARLAALAEQGER